MLKKPDTFHIVCILVIAFFVATGCENSFEPLETNDSAQFSMHGTFDLSADTQWVRIMPVMDSLAWTSPKPMDVEVHLMESRTGQRTTLNDSIFTFQKGLYAWNFWTAFQMNEGEEYKIIAEDSEGNSSSATFQMPLDFPAPSINYSHFTESGKVSGTGADTLVVADAIYDVSIELTHSTLNKYGVKISHLNEVNYGENGAYEFRLDAKRNIGEKFNVRQTTVSINRREVLVVKGDKNWPHIKGLVKEEIVLPNLNSNVENGIGVVVGIVSKRVQL